MTDFVIPPSKVDEAVDGGFGFGAGLREIHARGVSEFVAEGFDAALEHLGGAVEGLPFEVGCRSGPADLSLAGGADGVSKVFARGMAVVGKVPTACAGAVALR